MTTPARVSPGRRPGRLVGLDAVRGLAVIGMFAAHLGDPGEGWRDSDGKGWHWLWVTDGRASATFALLLGVTVSLMASGRSASERGAAAPSLRHTRVRLAVRGVVLLALGWACTQVPTGIAVILGTLGLFVLVSIFMLRWPSWLLVVFGLVAACGAPFLWHATYLSAFESGTLAWPLVGLAYGVFYTGVIWIAYPAFGMVVGRLDLTKVATNLRMAAVGAVLAVAGYVVAPLAGGAWPWTGAEPPAVWWLNASPHGSEIWAGYTPAEVLGNVGFTLLLLGALLPLGRVAGRWLAPLASVGAMALTAYVGQVVAITVIGVEAVWAPSNVTLVWFVLVTVGFCWAWRTWIGPGPLEWAMTRLSTRIADAVVPSHRPPATVEHGAPHPSTVAPEPPYRGETGA